MARSPKYINYERNLPAWAALLLLPLFAAAQSPSAASAKVRLADDVLYDSLLMRVLTLRSYDKQLPADATRPHVLQRYFAPLELSVADCKKIDELADRVNTRLKANHEQELAFIRLAKGNKPKHAPAVLPAEHKLKLQEFNATRIRELKQFSADLRNGLGPALFKKLDDHLNADVISRMHTLTPKTDDLPVPPRRSAVQ